MLRHFATGPVRWRDPIPCQTRTNWEIFGVFEGCCGLRFSGEERWVPYERMLWVFAPECSHGWTNVGGQPFHRATLHFSSVPDPLGEVVRNHGGWLARVLSEAEAQRVRTMAEALAPHFHTPTRVSPIHIQRCLAELALLLLEGVAAAEALPTLTDLAALRIERAMAWYAEHLARRPTVEEVAEAIHVSPSHLRRLFVQHRHVSPKAAFQRLRLERAMELMGSSTLRLEEVAHCCGYTSASHLCREYKALQHFTPGTWRRRLVDRFLDAVPAEVQEQDCNVRPRLAAQVQ